MASSALHDPGLDPGGSGREAATTADPADARGAATATPGADDPIAVETRNVRMMHLLERIAAAFNEAEVPLLLLKGGVLNLTLCEHPGDRPMEDLDLLVQPQYVGQAIALLEGLGGLRGEPLVREDFFPRFHYEMEYRLGTICPTKIDLHVRPFRPLRYAELVPPGALWSRAEKLHLARAHILIPCAEDMVIHLAAHAAFHGSVRGKWLADIKRWADAHPGIDWDLIVSTARRWHLSLPVLTGIQRAERLCGRLCPPGVAARLAVAPASWRDRLAMWHSPRDARHPVGHVLTNVLCMPRRHSAAAYLRAVLLPGRPHMSDWYGRRHWGWLPVAHTLRWLSPIGRRVPQLWNHISRIETRPSPIHGLGVFAIREFASGDVICGYHGRPVDREGTYVGTKDDSTGHTQLYEITGKLQFLNHSCSPNAELSGFSLIALSPLHAGQEITIDYANGSCSCRQDEHSGNETAGELTGVA